MPERRRVQRAKPDGLTYVKLEPDNGGTLLDVCESGLRFQVVAPVEESSRIQLWFVLDASSHIEVSGELAWIDETRRTGGLKFTHPSKQARQQLRAWLAQHRPERAKIETLSLSPPAPEPRTDEISTPGDFEGQLQNLPHADSGPLENLLDGILASLKRPHPEELFAGPLNTLDDLRPAVPADPPRAKKPVDLARDDSPRIPPLSASSPAFAQIAPARVPPSAAEAPPRPGRENPPRISTPSAPTPAVARSAPVRIPPSAPEAPRPLAREISADSQTATKSDPATETKYLQFRLAVDRVSGMLSTLRDAVESDDSEWPLTATPEYVPAAPAPADALGAAAEPAAAQAIPEPEAEPIAEPDVQAEMDVRPWSAGAPWRAAEPQVASSNWRTTLAERAREYVSAARQTIAPQFSRVKTAVAAAWTGVAEGSRVASAAVSSAAASASRTVKFGVSTIAARTSRPAKATAPAAALSKSRAARTPSLLKAGSVSAIATRSKTAELFQGTKGKLASAASVAKNATSSVLSSVVPAEPTPGEMRTLLVVTAVLLASLVAFSYRDKLTARGSNLAVTDLTEASRTATPPESNPAATAPAEAPAPKPAARRASQPVARVATARTEPEIITRRSSTPEFETALAFLGRNNSSYDPATAAKWLWAATRKGDTAANILLADLYIRGDGVPQNCAQGRILLLAASQKGNDEATRKLQQVDAGVCGSTGQ